MSGQKLTWLTFVVLVPLLSGVATAQDGAGPRTAAAPQGPDAGTAAAQEGPDPLTQQLRDQGLENVVVRRDGNEVRVAYENRRYRWQVTGLGVVLAAAAREAPTGANLVVTPKV